MPKKKSKKRAAAKNKPIKRNIYLGGNSTAGLPVQGKTDQDWEILLESYSTAYDSVNSIMLTKKQGVFDKSTEREIKARFAVIKKICKRHAPKLIKTIERIEKLSLDNLYGKISDKEYLRRIREIHRKNGLKENLINQAEYQVDQAERSPGHPKVKDNFLAPGNVGNIQNLFRPQDVRKNPPPSGGILDPIISPRIRKGGGR